MVEILGILATIAVLVSFISNKIKTIRIINIIGCILFIVYGILISSISVWILNTMLLILHIVKLIKKESD